MKLTALLAALALATPAAAHDTWFTRSSDGQLALGTGNRFPVAETPVDPQYVAAQRCFAAGAEDDAPPGACIAQLRPFDIELSPDKVALYFREIRPAPEIRQAWAEHRGRGEPFRERYTKFARIELDPRAAARPSGAAIDVIRLAPAGPVTPGSEAVFQVHRDGAPFAGFWVELVNEASPIGLWLRTDADGRLRARLPLPGRWLLRGTELRRAAGDAALFESRFVTYAFEVAAQKPISLTSNARSTNQMPATTAIASEPATMTQRR